MDKYYLGIDLGGTTCKFGLFNNKGKLISKWHISSQVEAKNRQKALLDNIVLSIKNHLSEHKLKFKNIKAIGMAVPGIVKKNSIIQEIVNISFNKKINIKNYFQKRFGTKLKVIAENDANVAALGEYYFGAGKNKNPFCHMIVGTGLGLGIIVDGKILEGADNTAGEFGHLIVAEDYNIKCNCGEYGCLETVSSGTGIAKLYYQMAKAEKLYYLTNNLIAKDIINNAKNGDEFSQRVLDKSMGYLAKAINELAKIINPELISIGGGVSGAGNIIIKYINNNLDKYSNSRLIKKPKVTIAKLKNDAGIFGALALVFDK